MEISLNLAPLSSACGEKCKNIIRSEPTVWHDLSFPRETISHNDSKGSCDIVTSCVTAVGIWLSPLVDLRQQDSNSTARRASMQRYQTVQRSAFVPEFNLPEWDALHEKRSIEADVGNKIGG